MLMATNQQHNDQMQQQEPEEEREEHRAQYKDQQEERCIEMQIYQDSIRQQSQFIMTMMIALMGNQRTIRVVPPTLPPIQINNDGQMQRDVGARGQRGEGMTEESNSERGDDDCN
jgi:hypothetical protein